MKIATWNINGVKARLDALKTWLAETSPDVACLQEIKTIDEGFPSEEIESLGYNVAVHGQKSFNGVALLSKSPLEDVRRRLPGDDSDEQARYIDALISSPDFVVRVASIYLPNGNPIASDKFAYKCAWMHRLERHATALMSDETPLVIAGDYNIIPEPIDAKTPAQWQDDALFQPESRQAFRRYVSLGLTDALRACAPEPQVYTFWDYQRGAWQKNDGIRIDHLLVSPEAADRLVGAGVDSTTRGWERPSDHAPVWAEFR
jgi:exodeoxyribonuclease III